MEILIKRARCDDRLNPSHAVSNKRHCKIFMSVLTIFNWKMGIWLKRQRDYDSREFLKILKNCLWITLSNWYSHYSREFLGISMKVWNSGRRALENVREFTRISKNFMTSQAFSRILKNSWYLPCSENSWKLFRMVLER